MQIIETNFKWSEPLKVRSNTKYIVLHHAGAQKVTASSIHTYHLSKGWSGIGYHFFISKDGNIYRGRPINTIGAHCSNYNSISLGICCEGDYSTFDKFMPEKQLKAVVSLLDYLCNYYPNAVIKGHKELGSTKCPGVYFPLDMLKNYKELLKGESMGKDCKCKRYDFLADIPDEHKAIVKKFIDKGIVKGRGNGELDLSDDMCRMLHFLDRMGLLM